MCCKRSYKDTVHSATMSLLIKQVSFEVFPQGGDGWSIGNGWQQIFTDVIRCSSKGTVTDRL